MPNTSATPWTLSFQAPLVHGISQAGILEWVAIPSPGDFPEPGINLVAPALEVDSLPLMWLYIYIYRERERERERERQTDRQTEN